MSEPVGNSSRGEFKGNSFKERDERPKAEAPEKAEKIIEGKVVTRKQSWWKRASQSFVAEDATSIGDYILVDVIVPAVRNLISDIVNQGTNRVLYGPSRHRGGGFRDRDYGGRRGGESFRTRYDRMGEPEPRRMLSRESRARHDFDEVILDTRAEAISVVEALIDRVDRFGFASVADLYDFVGVTGSWADQKWGWYDLRTADIRPTRGGFLLDLPNTEPMR